MDMIVGVFYCLWVSTFCLFEIFERVLSIRVKGSFCRATLPFQSFSPQRSAQPRAGQDHDPLSPLRAAARRAPAGFSVPTSPPLPHCKHGTTCSLLSLLSQGWPVPPGMVGILSPTPVGSGTKYV